MTGRCSTNNRHLMPHFPGSTRLMLVSPFAGTHFLLEAYRQPVTARYRFYSYGDCTLLLP